MCEPAAAKASSIEEIDKVWGVQFHRILSSTVQLDPTAAKAECLGLLAKPELPLRIGTKCNLLLGGICQDVMQAKHYMLEAEKQCDECLADCMEKDREGILTQRAIIREALEDLKPLDREFRMETGDWVGSDGGTSSGDGEGGCVEIGFRSWPVYFSNKQGVLVIRDVDAMAG